MKRTGILVINSNVAQLVGIRLARASAGDPFGAAVNFLANRGLDNGDFIWVTGTDSVVGTVPAMFISEAGPGLPALAALTATAATVDEEGARAVRSRATKSGGGRSRKGGAKKTTTKRAAAKKSADKESGDE